MKSVWSLIALLLLSLSACNQEDNDDFLNSEEQSLKVVNVIDGKIVSVNTRTVGDVNTMSLQFSSEANLQDVLSKLSNMSVNERIAFTDALGFVSLEKLLQIADAELDSIGAAAANETEFRTKYSAYKDKYSEIFVFNSQKLDDLSPYIPASTENDVLAYLVSGNHFIVVGNSIREGGFSNNMRDEDDQLYNRVEETSSVLTRAGIPVNSFKVEVNGKKTIFDTKINSEVISSTVTRKQLAYHFGAQKKMWYGWKRDSARDLIFTDKGLNLSGGFDCRLFDYADGNLDFTGAYTDLRAGLTRNFSGTVYVWTDMTVEYDEYGNMLFLDPIVVVNPRVKCYESKAYPCQISYTVSY